MIIAMEMETQNYNHNLLPKKHIAVFEFLVKMNLVPNVQAETPQPYFFFTQM